MEIRKAFEIISILADGVDPYTGEVLPKDSPYQNVSTVRALFLAMKGLKNLEARNKRVKNLPAKAGQLWSDQEDKDLIEKFEKGMSTKELSKVHARTEGAIRSRLIKLGKLTI